MESKAKKESKAIKVGKTIKVDKTGKESKAIKVGKTIKVSKTGKGKSNMEVITERREYVYRNAPIPGGGYITGITYNPGKKGLIYIRTDIGGTYRYDAEKKAFESLIEAVTPQNLAETFPIALGVEACEPEKLVIISGEDRKEYGIVSVSRDYGESFERKLIPTPVHGNLNGRGTGNRLVVRGTKFWFASQKGGLWFSEDDGNDWKPIDICKEKHLTFVWVSPDEETIVVGTAGLKEYDGINTPVHRANPLYVSYDGGKSFEEMALPDKGNAKASKLPGFVPQRYAFDGKNLYITLSQTGKKSYVTEMGYSCDSGDATGGRVLCYEYRKGGKFTEPEDITPERLIGKEPVQKTTEADRFIGEENVGKEPAGEMHAEKTAAGGKFTGEEFTEYDYGFSGIDCSVSCPGLVICTTICRDEGDAIYLSRDYGHNWELILCETEVGRLEITTSYLKTKYNGGHSPIHWASDIKIDPFDNEKTLFNTGCGLFGCDNLLTEDRLFTDKCEGIEETVHIKLYSPVKGRVRIIDAVGDYGAFIFENPEKQCENSVADSEGNRYLTCLNADFCDNDPRFIVLTARGNWKGKTKGGLIMSTDEGRSWQRLTLPRGLDKCTDDLCDKLETPNVNAGWVALSADAKHLVWSMADWIHLPIKHVVCTGIDCDEEGRITVKGWKHSIIRDFNGNEIKEGFFKCFADRTDSALMYGFMEESRAFVSYDFGLNFEEIKMPVNFPKMDFTLTDVFDKMEIRGEAGRTGVFYMALGREGLWKIKFDRDSKSFVGESLSKAVERADRMGLGILSEESDCFTDRKAIYMSGVIKGEYGFYASYDDGSSWVRINNDRQMFGDINSLEADKQIFGRVYIGSGSLGLIYGDIKSR